MSKPDPKEEPVAEKAPLNPAKEKKESPRPAPRWKPAAEAEEDDDDLFNDMPV